MRVLHTADWHAGRLWKHIDRLNELARVLDHLSRFLETERIDLFLMAGDVFDGPNPGADAERLVFEFFRRVGARHVPTVVIAGNHDSPGRIDAWGTLAELAGVRMVGRPRPATRGGVREVHTPGGETALVAALPFAGPGVFVSALELASEETHAKALYAERFKQAVHHLAAAFRPDCVNLLLAHTHLDGAVLANSERQVHLGEDWAAVPQALPAGAQYVALGHIHKPQRIEAAPVPAEYAGSPLQLDFGEVGQPKSFVVLDVQPGRPARIERIPYEGGTPLADVRLTLTELAARREELRAAGWLRVTVPLEQPEPELARQVRGLLPNALVVRPDLPRQAPSVMCESRAGKSPVDLYRAYHQRAYERPADAEVVAMFQHLYDQCGEDRPEWPMRPIRLRLKGFTSFKDETDVSFAGLDRFVISGPTGAGKSSLLDALTFALFANAPRIGTGALTSLVTLGRKSFKIVLDFRVGAQVYRVTRVRRRTGTGGDQLEKATAQGTFELVASGAGPVTTAVERLLGVNYAHFTQAVFLPQGKFAEFLEAKLAERRRLLNELLRLLVFARMQEHAGRTRDRYAGEQSRTERRLAEDLADVSEEALTDLERRHEEQKQLLAATGRELPILRQRREELRLDRERTAELERTQQELTRLQDEGAAIETARRELEAAGRAAAVVPLLDQADAAHREQTRRQRELDQAAQARDRCQEEYTAAAVRLGQATAEAVALPTLRDRAHRLAAAAGKVALRDQLAHQLLTQQQHQRELVAEHDQCLNEVQALAARVATVDRELAQARIDLTDCGYDEGRHRRLEAVRETAVRLQDQRRQLAGALRVLDRERAQAEAAEEAARKAEAEVAPARDAQDLAQGSTIAAERALRAAEDAHKAAHLRAALTVGRACPVCLAAVQNLPAGEPVPVLKILQRRLEKARASLNQATAAAQATALRAAAARATAQTAGQKAAAAQADAGRRQTAVACQEQTLEANVGEWLHGMTGGQVEERILDAVRAAAAQGEQHRQAAARVSALQSDAALVHQARQAKEAEAARLARDLRTLAGATAQTETAWVQVRQEIREAAGTDDPGPEQARVQTEIHRLEQLFADASRAAGDAKGRVTLAEANVETCVREARAAAVQAVRAEARAAEALADAGFRHAAGARAAFRKPDAVRALDARVTAFRGRLIAMHTRISQLEEELRGRRITAEEYQRAEQEHNACQARWQDAGAQVTLLTQQVAEMRKRLERVRQLRRELAEQQRRHGVYQQLAQDLRSDRFQAFVLEETLAGLVQEAAVQLTRLTGGRYGLEFRDDRIVVIDQDNAGEARGVETLSGGEKFLASLALALALGEQVRKTVGAVHLGCLFIDEGFGTLDAEALRTAADTLRGLQVDGRLVGVVTHIPELKEEFDQRVVDKRDGASRVSLEMA